MKKQKITNYLKTGILLFGISLLLWNCEKENINVISEPQNSIEKIQQSFNKEDFEKSIPYEFEVNWDLGDKHYSEELKTDYYEFPIRYTSSLTPHLNDFKKTKGNYYKSYKIIAIVKEKNITFYALRVYEKILETGKPISKVGLIAPSNFNGLMHLVDKENTIVYAKKLENGTNTIKDYFNKEFKKLDPYKSKMIEDCITTTTYYYEDRYKAWDENDGRHYEYLRTIYLGSSTETICGYTYLPDYVGGGGTANGEGTYQTNCVSPANRNLQAKSAYAITDPCAVKIINTFECGEGYVLGTDGKCVLAWPENTELFDVIEGPVIPDITEYLKCFDITQGATFTIYVDQPKENKSDTWSGAAWDPNVGHTFISITQGNTTRVMGLYPKTTVNPFSSNPSADGQLIDNSGNDFDVSVSINISASQLSNLRSQIISNNSSYNLNTYNCTDFGLKMANEVLSMGIPDSSGTWPGGGGSNPGNLGQDIRNMSLNNGITKNTTGGKAVSNSATCP
jgi:hypothetical protein